MTDYQLLQEYVKDGSQSAFAKVVEQHLALVYSSALRQVRDRHLAEDISQAVFLGLAQKAKKLGKDASLAGWLFTATRYASANAIRTRRRRMYHERTAAQAANQEVINDNIWESLSPFLDNALASLRKKEREAVLLHYFEGKSLPEVAGELSLTEDGARKRINKAIDKLRGFLRRKGVAVPLTAFIALLPSKAMAAVPVTLASATVSTAMGMAGAGIAGAAGVSGTISAITEGMMKMMFWTKMQTAAVITVAAVAVGGAAAPVVVKAMEEKAKPVLAKEIQPEATDSAQEMIVYKGVVKNEAGEPVEGVTVRYAEKSAECRKYEPPPIVATTAADGSFSTLPVIKAKEYNQEGYALLFEHPAYGFIWAVPELKKRYSIHPDSFDITLYQPKEIRGQITDQAGQPLPDAYIILELEYEVSIRITTHHYPQRIQGWWQQYPENFLAHPCVAKTDAEGRFVFKNIPEPARAHPVVLKAGYVSNTIPSTGHERCFIRGGEDEILQITMGPAGTIQGSLTFDGKPFRESGIVITARVAGGLHKNPYGYVAKVETDPEGKFLINSLMPGKPMITVGLNQRLKDLGLAPTGPEWVECWAGKESTIELKLEAQPRYSVEVLVVDKETGTPLPDRFVSASSADRTGEWGEAYTNTDGIATMLLLEGRYLFNVANIGSSFSRYLGEPKTIKPSNDNIPIKLTVSNPPLLKGKVIYPDKTPAAAFIAIQSNNLIKTNSQGEFESQFRTAINSNLKRQAAFAFDNSKTLGRYFFFNIAQPPQDLEIMLQPLASVEGHLDVSEGFPLHDLYYSISIVYEGPHHVNAIYSDKFIGFQVGEDGHFKITGIPTGLPVSIYLKKPGYSVKLAVADLTPGETQDLGEVHLKAHRGLAEGETLDLTGVLEGRVIDEAMNPASGVNVSVNAVGVSLIEDTTDSRGRFFFKGLAQGKKATITASGGYYSPCRVETVVGKTDHVLQIFPSGYHLFGKPAPKLYIEKWLNCEPFTLEDLQGQVVLLVLGVEVKNIYHGEEVLNEWQEKYGKQGLVILTLHEPLKPGYPDGIQVEDIYKFIDERRVKYPVAIDRDAEFIRGELQAAGRNHIYGGATRCMYDSIAYFLIDRQGILRASPDMRTSKEDYEKLIENLLAKEADPQNPLYQIKYKAPETWIIDEMNGVDNLPETEEFREVPEIF
ncbi:MAG: sigma-70 family RNA polymerase sigma factor [Planctomycetes bacterium]|nr:sigma-70 family RNA polymerase sigma factor [Planctomycetota bacterium]